MMKSVKVKNRRTGDEAELKGFNSAHRLLFLKGGLAVIDSLYEWMFFDIDSGKWHQCFRGDYDGHKRRQ